MGSDVGVYVAIFFFKIYFERNSLKSKRNHCVKSIQIRSFSGPQGYDQKRKLFRTNSFVLAHSSAKRIYIEQLTVKFSIQWYHMTLI